MHQIYISHRVCDIMRRSIYVEEYKMKKVICHYVDILCKATPHPGDEYASNEVPLLPVILCPVDTFLAGLTQSSRVTWQHDWQLAHCTGCWGGRSLSSSHAHPLSSTHLLLPAGASDVRVESGTCPPVAIFSVSLLALLVARVRGARAEIRESSTKKLHQTVKPGSVASGRQCTRHLRHMFAVPEVRAQEANRCCEIIFCVKTCCGPPFFLLCCLLKSASIRERGFKNTHLRDECLILRARYLVPLRFRHAATGRAICRHEDLSDVRARPPFPFSKLTLTGGHK